MEAYRKVLFGPPNPIVPPPWQTKDDRIRGGASQSYLSTVEGTTSARFHGCLDTSTLGGAGFASQFSPSDTPLQQYSGENEKNGSSQTRRDHFWRLAQYDGIELVLDKWDDGKEYTFIVRDEAEQEKRDDGRDKAGISWEIKFNADSNIVPREASDNSRLRFFFPWHQFKATFRGKEIKNPDKLKTDQIQRIGIMMRSYFGKQDGEFSLIIHSIGAIQQPARQAWAWWFPPCIAKLWALLPKKI